MGDSFDDRYSGDVLAGFSQRPRRAPQREVAAERELVVELFDGFVGAVVNSTGGLVELEDRRGAVRVFPLGGGFLIDGEPVTLIAPTAKRPVGALRTASGSLAVETTAARVALPSRIFVEGRHDAELVEKIWGADLRIEGVVVEYLGGIDDLEGVVRDFAPSPGRRLGVLVDHLVPGSKESRIAEAVARGPHGAHVLVVGHPFVDVWQAVKPASLGIAAWPTIDRSIEWKHGVCEAFGWPHDDQEDIANAWKKILSRARSFADLEPQLLGRVEQLIDFVTSD